MDSALRRVLVLGGVLVLFGGVVNLGVQPPVGAQETPTHFPFRHVDEPVEHKAVIDGESVFTNA